MADTNQQVDPTNLPEHCIDVTNIMHAPSEGSVTCQLLLSLWMCQKDMNAEWARQ